MTDSKRSVSFLRIACQSMRPEFSAASGARVFAIAACAAALAGCAQNNQRYSSGGGGVDPKYGVAASPRVVADGEAVPKGGGQYMVGRPYKIAGKTYYPSERRVSQVGTASWYGADFHGGKTANGEIFDMHALTAAHKTLPLPSYAEVTNLANGRTVLVRINNRGPFVGNRLIDLSRGTARILGFEGKGLSRVRVRYIGRAPLDGDTSRERAYLMAQRWYREMVASGGLRAAPPRRTAAN